MPSLRAARGGDRDSRTQFTDFASVWAVVDRNNIVHEGQGKYTYVGAGGTSDEDIGLVKTVNPLDSCRDGGMSSFEIVLTSTGEKKFIALGVCSDKYPSHSLPGWERVSVGLHMDDGALLQSPNEAIKTNQVFQKCDSIKCSVRDIPSDATEHAAVEVEFFCNNDPVISTVTIKPPGGFHGVIGMMSKGEAITLCPPVTLKKLRFEEVWEISAPDLVQHTEDGVCRYIGPGDLSEHFIGTFRSIKPVEPLGNIAQRSFSLRIIDPGEKNFIGMGVVNETYPTGLLPGWEDSSIGYHADSGDIFHRSSDGDPTNCPCGKGDTMQCVVRAIDNSPKRIQILFLRNGVNVKEVTDWTPSTGFYFCFGMMSKGERVQAILPEVSIPFSTPKLSFEDVWEIKNPNIEHSDSGICRYVGQDKVGTVRSKHPIDPFSSANYFEVKIVEPGKNCYIALGVCNQLYSTEHLPGWEDLSVGYHADEGAIMQCAGQERVGDPCEKGDVIQCTLEVVDGSDKQMNVIFHKNGSLLGKTIFWKPGDGKVFAQVGCMSEGEVIQIASPQQGMLYLRLKSSSTVQSPSESRASRGFLSPVPGAQGITQNQYSHHTMYPGRMEIEHFFEEMCSKFHGFVPPHSGSHSSLVPGMAQDHSMPLTSWDSSRHTAPQDLSSSYPVPYSQSSHTGQKMIQTQMSEPPFISQRGYFPQMSASSSSSSTSSKAEPPYQLSQQFSVSSVSSLESLPENEEKGVQTSQEKQHQLFQSIKPTEKEYVSFSVPSLPTLDPPTTFEESATSLSSIPLVPEATLQPSSVSTLHDPETSEKDDDPVPILKSSSIVVDPVILEKSESNLFKILYNTEVDAEGSLEYARLHEDSPENSFVMFRLPLNEKCSYFEAEILEKNEGCNIAVGIVWDHYPVYRLPGILDGSVAFHTKDNCIWQGKKPHQSEISSSIGDVLGCRVDLCYKSEVVAANGKEALVLVEFFRNSILLHKLELVLPPSGFFPAIGMTGFGSKITVRKNPLLKPDSYFNSHPLPSEYFNFEMPSSEAELWQSIAHSTVTNGHLFSTELCCGKPGVVQCNLPFSVKSDYFQVRLLSEIGSYSVLSIGIASKLSTDSIKVIPGEISNSVAYLPLLGFFMSSGVICCTIPAIVGSNLYGKDVVLGLGVLYCGVPDPSVNTDDDKKIKTVEKIKLFFTVNGQQIHDIFIDKPTDDIYPTLAFEHDCSTISEPLARLEFPKAFPYKENGLPFGFCRGKQDELATLFDSYTLKDVVVTESPSITRSVHAVQASQPLSPSQSYFEIKVVDGGETYKISCGLACFNYPMDMHPGWMGNSIALHVDDGNLFLDGNYTNVMIPPRYPGVLIGCGIRFSSSGSLAEVFFTVNKQIILCRLVNVPQLGLYPTIGMRTKGGVIDVNIHTIDPFPSICFKSEVEILQNITLDGSHIQLQSSSNPGAILIKACSQHQRNYIEVTSLSEKNGRIMVGYSTDKSCPLNFLKSQAFKACVVEIVSGKLMIYNQYYKSRDMCSITSNSVIGVGLEPIPNSKMLLLFVVSNGYIVSYSEIDIEDSEIYPCMLMMDSTTKINTNWCSFWPKLTPIGYGWGALVNLKLVDFKITHSSNQNKKRLPIGYAQAATPFSHFSCYFEVEICSRATNKAIAIGLASRTHSTAQWIGWSENSIGYHTDDGKLFKESSSGQSFGPKAYAGDIIGCGARMKRVCIRDTVNGTSKAAKVEFFFTINGALLTTQKMAIPPGGLFPTLCLESPSESVIFHRYDEFPPVPNLIDTELWSNAYSVKQVGNTISNSCRHKEINGGLPKSFCQAKLPFSPEYPYFQVELASLGANPKGSIFVGASVKIPVGCTTPNTHSLFYSSAGLIVTRKGTQKATKGSVKSDVGDIVGCLISFNNDDPIQLEIFLNCSRIHTAPLTDLWTPQNLYPTIILSHPGDSVIPYLQMKFPSWDVPPLIGWLRSERVQVHNNIIEYTGKADRMSDIGVAQLSQPLQLNSLTYFEVEIISSVKCVLGVGAASSDYPLSRQPGWCKHSIAYHGDDGKLFHEDGVGVPFSSAWKQYDIIGVGVRPDYCNTGNYVQIYFARNGVEVGHTTTSIPPNGFFPIVGFHYEGLKVKINRGVPGTQLCNLCPLKSQWRALVGIAIKKSSRGQLLRYCVNDKDTRGPYLISLAIYGQHFCDKMQYFEVELHNMGPIGIAIGVVPQKYPLNHAPGWSAGSVAYHTDNGRLYNAASKGKQFGPIAQCGDSIGCGVAFHPNNTKFCSVFFTHNGMEIGLVKVPFQVNGLYPAVALTNVRDSISVNFSETFKSRLSFSDVVLINLMRINNCSYTDNIISFMGSGSSGVCCTPAIAQFSIPLSRSYSYYSASILECSDDMFLGLAVKDYPLQYAPGITSVSLAYDVMKGSVRAVYNSDHFCVTNAEVCVQGDTIGCGIYFTDDTKKESTYAYFTHNNKQVCKLDIPDEILFEDLYPVVGFIPQKKSSFIFMNWNCIKFVESNVF